MTSFSSTAAPSANYPSLIVAQDKLSGLSANADVSPGCLSDEELEQHIKDCGWQAQLAMCRWEAHGCFSDRGDADRWMLLMYEAIALRSPETVARMERERGLA